MKELLSELGLAAEECAIPLGYKDYDMDAVLRAILPAHLTTERDPPAAYAIAGHIAHLNLRQPFWPYKHAIARVLLDKSPGIRTVVNKLGTIQDKFRFFPMELLAGDPDLHVSMVRFPEN